MISGQDQKIGDNSVAVQSKGDVTINQGITITQMGEIMVGLKNLVNEFTAEAKEVAEKRFEKFQEETLKKFSDKNQANPEAFKDPDFQFLLRNAQTNYARDGNESTGSLLIELLAERSKLPKRDRIALILNEATEKISKITDEDVAILSIGFMLLHTGGGCVGYRSFVAHLSKSLSPFINDIKEDSSSAAYLESLGCLSINPISSHDLYEVIREKYGELFTDGFSADEIGIAIQDASKCALVKSCVVQASEDAPISFNSSPFSQFNLNVGTKPTTTAPKLFRFRALSATELNKILDDLKLSPDDLQRVSALVTSKHWDIELAKSRLRKDVTGYSTLERVWPKSGVQNISLTSVGIALGHASVVRSYPEFKPPLAIWIK